MSEDINSGWTAQPQNPPEFAHLREASEKTMSPPSQQSRTMHVADPTDDGSYKAQHTLHPQNTGSNPWGDSLPLNGMLHAPPLPSQSETHEEVQEPGEGDRLRKVETSRSASSANDTWAYEAISKQTTASQLQPQQPDHAPPPPPGPPGREAPGAPTRSNLPTCPQELPAYPQESSAWDEEEAEHFHTPMLTPESTSQGGSAHNLQAPELPSKAVYGSPEPQVDLGSPRTNPWDESSAGASGSGASGAVAPNTGEVRSQKSDQPPRISIPEAREEGGWENLDKGLPTSPTGRQESGVVTSGDDHIMGQPNELPALPPRSSTTVEGREEEGIPPVMPPRPSLEEQPSAGGHTYNPPPGPPPGHTSTNNQKYQIKKISWHDHSSSFNPRLSPILTQNANGPCPLLALVNALILSTPSDKTNEIAQYLTPKTEVSLEDLLQAIINEHLSEENCSKRARQGQEEYPDIGELHEFLKRLHTGMNVNPRFLPEETARSPESLRRSMSHVHPSARSEESIPGGFEQTKELELYASFGIRLIHGWLPEPSSPAYAAFERHAQTHEDAQLILLRQDELEHKLENSSTGGLTEQEAELLQDIYLMGDFQRNNPTQLSPFGLEAIRTSVRNGEFAILFRNSHFLVVYKHPETEMLFCLVTDEGYREQVDAVWESLMDCDGSSLEIFSGDFSIMSGLNHQTGETSSSTAVESSPSGAARRPGLDTIDSNWLGEEDEEERSRREREDADMAFALSIQDEFNEESEAQEARRRREQELSERFIESSRGREGDTPNTLPINRPEGGLAPAGMGRGTWASRGGAGPIGPARGALSGGRSSMLDLGPSSPIGGPRVSIPTRRRTGATQGGPFTPISPVTNAPRPLPVQPIPIPSHNDHSSGIPASLLQQPQRPLDPEAGVDNPPPSYEQAASQPKYEGPVERPAGNAGPAVAGGVIGEAAGVNEHRRSTSSSNLAYGGPAGSGGGQAQGDNRRQSLGLRETISAQRRRVSEMRRQQVAAQAGISPNDARIVEGQARRKEEGDCVLM